MMNGGDMKREQSGEGTAARVPEARIPQQHV